MMHRRPRRSHPAEWLSLAAAPTFALMAACAFAAQGGSHPMACSAAAEMSPLRGMIAMYALMSAFHLPPWLKLIAAWQNRGGSDP
ncbi:MAG: hypothetical protein JSR36_15175 [Proteobacteria bacterium]|nr:hypothetical protein [Pseudomonadota bacterium]